MNHLFNLWHVFRAGQACPSAALFSPTQPDCFALSLRGPGEWRMMAFVFNKALHAMMPCVREEIVHSQFAAEASWRLALCFVQKARHSLTWLMNISVLTPLLCWCSSQEVSAVKTGLRFTLTVSWYLDLFIFLCHSYIIIRFKRLQLTLIL